MKLRELRALVIFLLAFHAMAFAQMYYTWQTTDNNMTIALLGSANPTLGGVALQVADQIGLFTPGGVCVGGMIWNGGTVVTSAWGAYGSIPGLLPGESVHYRLWRPSLNKEFTVVSVTYSMGDGIYAVNKLNQINGFTATAYALTLVVSPSGFGTTTPAAGSYLCDAGEVVAISATAGTGYEFNNWTGDVANSGNASTTVTMNANKTVTANFAMLQYTLTMASSPSGGGTTTPSVGTYDYDPGTTVNIEAVPATGYDFVNWTGSVTNPNSISTTVILDCDKTVTANFALKQHSLTMALSPSGSGTTDPAVGTHTYSYGITVNISATPVAGYVFINWTGAVANPNSASTMVFMDGDKTVTANFIRQYTLTMAVSPSGGGTTDPAAGGHAYNTGTLVNITATPATGYVFVNWTGAVANPNSASTTVSMDGDKTVTANFNLRQCNIILPQGWSLISSYVIPENSTLDAMMSGIISDLVILKNGIGRVYWPELLINSIGSWDYLAGYQIYLKQAATLTVNGLSVVPESTPISLVQGWNMIAYLRNSSQSIETALEDIVSNMLIAKNGLGQVYWPVLGINSIVNMVPGQGYQIYMTQVATLTYQTNVLGKEAAAPAGDFWATKHYQPQRVNSGQTAVIGIVGDGLEDGDEVSAWDRNGRLLAAGAVSSSRSVLVVAGDDPLTEGIREGLVENEAVYLKYWRKSDGQEMSASAWKVMDALTDQSLGYQLAYANNAVFIIQASASEVSLPADFGLKQNYPNPFNPETTICFELPQAAHANIAIYNLQGQLIRTLVDDERIAGTHTIIWNGRNENGLPSATGIYLIRMQASNFSRTLKISFIK